MYPYGKLAYGELCIAGVVQGELLMDVFRVENGRVRFLAGVNVREGHVRPPCVGNYIPNDQMITANGGLDHLEGSHEDCRGGCLGADDQV